MWWTGPQSRRCWHSWPKRPQNWSTKADTIKEGCGTRTRNKSYADYGFLPEDVKKWESICRKPDIDTRRMLRDAAYDANPEIAEDLIFSLANGLSYERMEVIKVMGINLVDFYAYRRKTLAIFRDKMR